MSDPTWKERDDATRSTRTDDVAPSAETSRSVGADRLSDAEMACGIRAWRSLPDPFPKWQLAEPESDDTRVA